MHRSVNLPGVGDIQIKRQTVRLGVAREFRDPRFIAGRDHGAPATREHEFRNFMAETGGATGNEPYRRRMWNHR